MAFRAFLMVQVVTERNGLKVRTFLAEAAQADMGSV